MFILRICLIVYVNSAHVHTVGITIGIYSVLVYIHLFEWQCDNYEYYN